MDFVYGIGELMAPRTCGAVPSKSHVRSVAVDGDRDGDANRVGIEAVVVDVVGEGVAAVGHRSDRVAREALGLVEEGVRRNRKIVGAFPLDEREVAAFAGEARGVLRADVAEDLLRHPHVRRKQLEQRRDRHSGLVELDGWDAQPFLVDLGGVRPVAAGRLAADIGLVADADGPADPPLVPGLAGEDGLREVEVR